MRLLLALPLMLAPLAAAWADSPPAGARISLSVHEQADLPNDEVVVVYRVAARGRRPARLRAEVNRVGDVIHARLSREPGLKQMTLSRRMDIVWRYDDALRRQVRDGWRLVQRERVVSQRLDAATRWIDAIEQAGGKLESLSFRVSDEAARQARERLRLRAIQRFRSRAAAVARALGASRYRIVELRTDVARPSPPVRVGMAMMKSAAPAAPPSLAGGEGRVSLTVSGVIALPPRDYTVR